MEDAGLESQSRVSHAVTEREPVALAHEAIHDVAEQILGELPRGSLLDVPAGEGALAARLLILGFDVRCCDLYPEIFRLRGTEIKRGDLNNVLPYREGEFDYVTCIEGIEHIENPQQAVREFRRLLRPGGHLIVSTPNILNIEERVKWLLYGYTSHFKPISREHLENLRKDVGEMEEVALHVNPISYSELRYTLEKYGFEVQRLYRDKPKKNLWAYSPIVLLIRLLGRLTPERKRRERWTLALQSNEVLLGGNTLIVHAIRR
ncbi:MAG TPA: class I SAM-dependent methyltransferase [Pyrinomonadaceae bacterium]|nr:class I SAM-dependent methyltransferase [Pyrinomonadaceae bacterium]